MVSKTLNQRKHFKRRMQERFGIAANREEQNELIKLIQNNQTTMVFKQSNRISHHEIEKDGKKFIVVYDKLRKCCVTALYTPKGETVCEVNENFQQKK